MTRGRKAVTALLAGLFLLVIPVTQAAASSHGAAGSPPAHGSVAKAHGTTTTAVTAPGVAVTPSFSVSHDLLAPPACPTGDACGTIPATCPSGTTCPTYQVGPVSDLGPAQWVYVNLYDWTSTPGVGDYAQINYCSDTAPLPSDQLCVNTGGQGVSEVDYQTEAFPNGATSVSFQVLEVDSTSTPLSGAAPGDNADTGAFFCNAASPCSVDITDTGPTNSGALTLVPSTTAVVPVSFLASGSGCPGANTVNTQSDFGSDILFPVAARIGCGGPDPTIAFNTAIDGLSAVTSLQQGLIDVAFTDDPEQADQQVELKMGNFALIPIALSANVVSFTAEERTASHQQLVPLDAMDLTPRMVAGLLTGYYENIATSDVVACQSSGCTVPPCPVSTKKNKPITQCSLMNEVNFDSAFLMPQSFAGYVRSDTAGPTGQLFAWLCKAPVVSVSAVGANFSEPSTAAAVLQSGLNPTGKPLATCPTDEQFPPVRQGLTSYLAYQGPSQQALKIVAAVQPTLQQAEPYAGFASMDWADAEYFGMSVAALQNPSGNFVLPTQQSLDAAVSDATENADGSLTPNYTTTDPNAYPMPSITYAVVPTRGVSATQAAADQAMLSQVLNLTGGSDTPDLPAGFVPLPSALYQQAQNDIANDFANEGAPTTTTTAPSGPSGSSGSSGSGTAGSAGPAPVNGQPGGTASAATASAGANAPSGSASPSHTTTTPGTIKGTGGGVPSTNSHQASASPSSGHHQSLSSLSLVASASSNLLPVVILLGILALLMGSLLFLSAGLRRHVFDTGHALSTRIRAWSAKVAVRLKKVPGWLGAARSRPGPV